MTKKNDVPPVGPTTAEELKTIAVEGDKVEDDKPTRKKRAPRKKTAPAMPDETVQQYSKMFVPLVSVTGNAVFKRLKWETLTGDEEILLTDAITKVGAKYLPTIFEKYAEEMNLLLVLGSILAIRMIPRISPEKTLEEVPIGV